MNARVIRELLLYRYRYTFAVIALLLVVAMVVILPGFVLPEGMFLPEIMSLQEHQSVGLVHPVADAFAVSAWWLSDLFGPSELVLRLPTIILVSLTIILFAFIARGLIHSSITLIGVIILGTSSIMMSLVYQPIDNILLVFLTTLMLMFAQMSLDSVGNIKRFDILGACFAGILLLYVPYGIYILLPLVITSMIHPRTRAIFNNANRIYQATIILLCILAFVPLLLASTLGDVSILEWAMILNTQFNGMEILRQLYQAVTVSFSAVTPYIQIAAALIAVYGLMLTVQDRHSLRSHIIFSLLVSGIIITVLESSLALYALIVPSGLLLIIGLHELVMQWYGTFPNNPYARISGLVPISILVVTIVVMQVIGTIAQQTYSERPRTYVNKTIEAISRDDINRTERTIVSSEDKLSFYDRLTDETVNVESEASISKPGAYIISNDANAPNEAIPFRIIVNGSRENATVLRIYNQW